MIRACKRREGYWMNIVFPDLIPWQKIKGIFGDSRTRIIHLARIQKNSLRSLREATTKRRYVGYGISHCGDA
ncbi:MAG: hypothetical protein D8M57_19950 [Candidatus Scalindua sp. AMX11]|nr:MAG: hypothetical protein EX341_19215 [Candidatus Scalindua sp. SCAELEC01]TDE63126.1 MAG: hypothetical protein D8M57_19950 [Candidatus Scalindua sp. AMX11]